MNISQDKMMVLLESVLALVKSNREGITKELKTPTMNEEDKEYVNPIHEAYAECLTNILLIGEELKVLK